MIKYYRTSDNALRLAHFNPGMSLLQLGTTSIPKCLSKLRAACHQMTMWNDCTPEDGQDPVSRCHWTIPGISGECYLPKRVDLCFRCVGREHQRDDDGHYSYILYTYQYLWGLLRCRANIVTKKGGLGILSSKRSERLRDYGLQWVKIAVYSLKLLQSDTAPGSSSPTAVESIFPVSLFVLSHFFFLELGCTTRILKHTLPATDPHNVIFTCITSA